MTAISRDQRGAIMVLGLFMAIFATGCLFYLVGLGEAIARRERMQDAADAAAFSAAVLHARGMNVIALVNMTMAALLAALIVLKLVELAGYIGVAVATGLAFITSGASLGAVPPFSQLAVSASEAHEAAKPGIQASLRALRLAARGVRVAMPWVAQARAAQAVADHYAPPAIMGLAVPGRVTLPTRDGTYLDLCHKAGEYVGDLIELPFRNVPTPGFSIGEITAGLIGTGSSWFCDAEGGERPGTTVTREIWHPILPKARECEREGEGGERREGRHALLCAEAEQQSALADAAIDRETGACVERTGHDCGTDGLYELRASLARQACAPRDPVFDRLREFTYQERSFARRYTWHEDEWTVEVEQVPGTERYRLQDAVTRPCGSSSHGISPAWNLEPEVDGERVPICHDVAPPSAPPGASGHTVELVHTEVLKVFRCLEIKTERREIEGDGGELAAPGEEGQAMAPQLIAEGARLGEEDFQVRAVVLGSEPSSPINPMLSRLRSAEAAENHAHLAAWRATSTLGRVAFAQAEHYFDARDPRDEDLLWSMLWTARLRRFRAAERQPSSATSDDLADAALYGTGDVHASFASACTALAPEDFPCGAIDLSMLAELAAH